MADISKYTAQVVQAFRSKNGKALAQELSLPYSSGGKRVNRLLFQLIESLKRTDVPSFCNSRISDSSIAQLVSSRLGAVAAVFENDFSEGRCCMEVPIVLNFVLIYCNILSISSLSTRTG